MAENLSEQPAAAWYRADLDRVQAELVAVVRQHMPRVGYQLIAHAVLEFTGAVLADIVTAVPTAAPDMEQRLDHVKLHVATAGQQQH